MRKFLPYILILTVILQIFAPFTIGSGVKNNLAVEINKAEAEYTGIVLTTTNSSNNNSIKIQAKVVWSLQMWGGSREGVMVNISNESGQIIYSKEIDLADVPDQEKTQQGEVVFSGLNPDTNYVVTSTARQVLNLQYGDWPNIITWNFSSLWDITPEEVATFIREKSLSQTIIQDNIKTLTSENQTFVDQEKKISYTDEALLPNCELLDASTWGGCIGIILYKLIFKPTSVIFGLTGRLLDIAVNFSIKDTSYRSTFVVEGWGIVRDFCNIFFIFILLYIAIGTILNLHSVKTKEMVINVVIIGLLINFSLFATQIIIDTSNILTRVFYNSNTIKVGVVDTNTGEIKNELGSQNEIQLSQALVSKINPQKLLIQSAKVDNIRGSGDSTVTTKDINAISPTTFILVVVLISIINIVGIIVFLSSSLIFITRVIGLWMAIIFSPFVFFSYTVPGLQDMDMVGWKKWWPETIKLAFLAPVFVFFLYLIIMFLKTDLGLAFNDEKGGLDFILGIFIPFIFIMVLLWKAKDIAKNLSGKMGTMITNGVATVGGVALGAGLGGVAMAMRGTVGRAGSALANSERVKNWEKKGYLGAATLRDVGKFAGKASLDVRGIKIGGKNIGDATGMKVGKVKEGGFEKIKEERIESRVKRAKELETGEGSKEKREANELEAKIRTTKAAKATDLNKVEKDIATLKERMLNQKAAGLDKDAEETYYELEAKNREKAVIRGGKFTEVKDKKGVVRVSGITTTTAGGIADLEDQLNKLNDKINDAQIKAMNKYAADIESMGNKTINYFKTLGQHSGVGANIAADRIRRGVKIEDKTKH